LPRQLAHQLITHRLRYVAIATGNEPTIVMQSYSTVGHVIQEFTYGDNQSSSLEVGLSASGAKGSFYGDKSVSVSTTDSQGFPNKYGRYFVHWKTGFSYEKIKNENVCPKDDSYNIMAYDWDGGAHFGYPKGAPAATFCVNEPAGAGYHKHKTKASTVQAGFSIPAVGFTGSAQTGYTYTAEISFYINVHSQLCGVKNTPPNDPGVLVVSRK
jgi:hypothetical protein